MIQSHDELIMEMTKEYGLDRMGENDNDDKGNTAACHTPKFWILERD
jgi:hypothetical protein